MRTEARHVSGACEESSEPKAPLTPFREDSLRKRYVFKMFGNLIGLGFGAVTQAVIPRGLGPKAYGDFNFLTNFFTQVISFLDMGTSTAYYTKLSQRPGELLLVTFYTYLCGVIALATLGSVLLPVAIGANAVLWPDQALYFVLLAAIFGILTWIVTILTSMADAYGITVRAEILRLSQRIVGLILIVIMLYADILDLETFFYYHCAILLLLGAVLLSMMRNRTSPWHWRLPLPAARAYAREFYEYSHPLFTYTLVGLCTSLFDRWMLQTYCGSEEQGYFGLSFQVSAICFLFTGAMTPLFMRELSIAFGNQDRGRMADLFHRYIPLLYAVAAFFSCFIIVQAEAVTLLFGGRMFMDAVPTVVIMALFPLHQTYGQLSGSVFLATGQTVLYRNIGLVMMLIGLPVTYFIIAPPAQGGLGMGANGLAIKMVVLNIVWVNIQLYYNARYLSFSFREYLEHQLLSAGCLIMLAMAGVLSAEWILGQEKSYAVLFLAGALYTMLVILSAYLIPRLFGLKKDDLRSLGRSLREWLSGDTRHS